MLPYCIICNKKPCCGSRSGIRCLLDPWIWDPESRIGFSRSRISNPRSLSLTFESSVTNFLVKTALMLCQLELAKKIFCTCSKYFQFKKFVAAKKGKTTHFFPLLFCYYCWIQDPGSEIQDLRSGIQDLRSGIRDLRSGIRDLRSRIQDPRFEIRDPRSEIRDPRSKI